MEQQVPETIYRLIHPEIVRWDQGEKSGLLRRDWVYLSFALERFTIKRGRVFNQLYDFNHASGDTDALAAEFAALSGAEKKELLSKDPFEKAERQEDGGGYYLNGATQFDPRDTITAAYIDNFDGNDKEPWFRRRPYQVNSVGVMLGESKKSHGSMWVDDERRQVSLNISVASEVVEDILKDLNSSSEAKRIEISIQARVFEFENDGEGGPKFLLIPSNYKSVPVVLNRLDVVLYDHTGACASA